jgi:hypothetical protein
MQKPILASAFAFAVLCVGSASAAATNYKDPLDAQTLSTIKSHFSELMEVANRHDLKALHLMFGNPLQYFWSPRALFRQNVIGEGFGATTPWIRSCTTLQRLGPSYSRPTSRSSRSSD